MSIDPGQFSGLALMFLLGLRHGVDPDHVAIIDSMVFRSLKTNPGQAPWVGTLFALGHGLTVTLIAVGLGSLTAKVALPAQVLHVLEWLPVALLVLVGTLNLRELLSPCVFRAVGWKTHFLPARLRASSHPLAIFAVGVLFALVFDTATQAAAWGYAATARSGAGMALLVGLVFTAGMVITDTFDCRLMVRLLRRAATRDDAHGYRRKVGWVIVAMSYGIAAYSIARHFIPEYVLSDLTAFLLGITLVLGALVTYVRFGRHLQSSRSSYPE